MSDIRRFDFHPHGSDYFTESPTGDYCYWDEVDDRICELVEALELARRTLAMAALEGEVTRRIDSALAAHQQGGEA